MVFVTYFSKLLENWNCANLFESDKLQVYMQIFSPWLYYSSVGNYSFIPVGICWGRNFHDPFLAEEPSDVLHKEKFQFCAVMQLPYNRLSICWKIAIALETNSCLGLELCVTKFYFCLRIISCRLLSVSHSVEGLDNMVILYWQNTAGQQEGGSEAVIIKALDGA